MVIQVRESRSSAKDKEANLQSCRLGVNNPPQIQLVAWFLSASQLNLAGRKRTAAGMDLLQSTSIIMSQ
jgi:hypothetical protein